MTNLVGMGTIGGRAYESARGHVEALREDVNDLADALGAIQSAAKLTHAKARRAELDTTLASGQDLLIRHDLPARIDELAADLESDEHFAARHSAQLTRIQNQLSRLKAEWPTKGSQATTGRTASVAKTISELEYSAVEFCAVDDLNDALSGLRTGKSLSLDEYFSRSLASSADRDRVVAYLKANEQRVDGVVDAGSRLAYRTPPSKTLRFLACVSPLAFFAAGGGLLLFISRFDNWDFGPGKDWPLSNGAHLLGAYLLLTGGAIAHLLVENVKLLQSKQVPILAIGDLLTWLELRWAGLAGTFVAMVITVIALRYSGVTSDAREIPVWLAAGYSVDSIAGLVLTRFDTAASAGVQTLRQRLTGASS